MSSSGLPWIGTDVMWERIAGAPMRIDSYELFASVTGDRIVGGPRWLQRMGPKGKPYFAATVELLFNQRDKAAFLNAGWRYGSVPSYVSDALATQDSLRLGLPVTKPNDFRALYWVFVERGVDDNEEVIVDYGGRSSGLGVHVVPKGTARRAYELSSQEGWRTADVEPIRPHYEHRAGEAFVRPTVQAPDPPHQVTWNDVFLDVAELPPPGRWVDIAGPLATEPEWQGAETSMKVFSCHPVSSDDLDYNATLAISAGQNASTFIAERRAAIASAQTEFDALCASATDESDIRLWVVRSFDTSSIGDESVGALSQKFSQTTPAELLSKLPSEAAFLGETLGDTPLSTCSIGAVVNARVSWLTITLAVHVSESAWTDENLLAARRTFAISQARLIAALAANKIVALKPPPLGAAPA